MNIIKYHCNHQLQIEQHQTKEQHVDNSILSMMLNEKIGERDNIDKKADKIEKYTQLSLMYYIRFALYAYTTDNN